MKLSYIYKKRNQGEYSLVNDLLIDYLKNKKHNYSSFKNAFYLRLEALRFLNKHDESRRLLDNMPFKDSSFDYLKAIRRAVDSTDSFIWLEAKLFHHAINYNDLNNAIFNYAIVLRDFKLYDKSISYLEKRLIKTISKYDLKNKKIQNNIKADFLWKNKANEALKDLHTAFKRSKIDFFLLGGTLLGLVREGELLNGDDDLDIGVDEKYQKEFVKQSIFSSGKFYLLENKVSSNFLSFMHENGVKTDVFIHYKKDEKYIHDGACGISWKHTPFELKEIKYMNLLFLIPKDFEFYLEENYGIWENKIENYETLLDTKNIYFNDLRVLYINLLIFMHKHYINGDTGRFFKCLSAYRSKYKEDFIKKFGF